jgi:hypothetical protein
MVIKNINIIITIINENININTHDFSISAKDRHIKISPDIF